MPIQEETIEQVNLATSKYKYGFSTNLEVDKAPKGLSEETIKLISEKATDKEEKISSEELNSKISSIEKEMSSNK